MDALPAAETDRVEYKSGRTKLEELKEKLSRAASGFWNSGGGLFVAGVDDEGKVDGQLASNPGKQSWGDWVDQVVHQVEPTGPYCTTYLDGTQGLTAGAALLVGFGVSSFAPHMAPDLRYYIRAGAHTVPARHFVVEALRSSRALVDPSLHCLLDRVRDKNDVSFVVRLTIAAANVSPALDVRIAAEGILGRPMGFAATDLTKRVPFIDQSNPFRINLGGVSSMPEAAFLVHVTYSDLRGRHYEATHSVDTKEQLGPIM